MSEKILLPCCLSLRAVIDNRLLHVDFEYKSIFFAELVPVSIHGDTFEPALHRHGISVCPFCSKKIDSLWREE